MPTSVSDRRRTAPVVLPFRGARDIDRYKRERRENGRECGESTEERREKRARDVHTEVW